MAEHQQQRRLVLPLKTRIATSIITTFSDSSLRTDGTVNRRPFRILSSLGLMTTPPNPKPLHGVATSDVTVDAARNLWFRLYVPTTDTETDLPVIVFFHGGGFVHLAPDVKAYDFVCRRFARKVPAVVVSVNYRLAPEHRYPAQYDDGFDVLKFLDAETSTVLPRNADLSRCFLAGDSAGANLSHHVAKRVCECDSEFTQLKASLLY
ncbi:hypothetical protein RD792_008690 [Penstemon davidsonii]|uniref:Alpha/beta hydrolase fold-3 domain-containing protein n=1 Tax=Penstemon davidsonii TaxID=160366 RepID=A0ABR0DB43_9LAMI|nr:hypothetical protein RD792_008690 [Penstemon davidsonii]